MALRRNYIYSYFVIFKIVYIYNFVLQSNLVNLALHLAGNLLFGQNVLTPELFIIHIYVSVRKKFNLIRKRLIRNSVIIRNFTYTLLYIHFTYTLLYIHFNSGKSICTHIIYISSKSIFPKFVQSTLDNHIKQ
jgi:hypothetical protein